MLNIGERVLFGVLFFGVFFIINLSFAFAEDTVDDTLNITVPISCSLSATGTNSHTATIIPGTYSGASGSEYENGIGSSTLTTFCNDAGGYAIYAIGYTNNEYGNNTLEGTNTSSIINTKVYASGDTASNWSMRVNKVTDTSESYLPNNLTITNSFDSWHTVPDDYIKVANYTVNTDIGTNAKGSKITTTYASFIASAQLADTYNGQVLYTLVHPNDAVTPMKPIDYTINYNANAGTDTVSNLPPAQTGTTSDATITLSTMEPTRDDYIFDSWCTTNTSETSCSGASYSSGDALPTNLLSNPNHTITLYAVWANADPYMQDVATWGPDLAVGDEIEAIDSRDRKKYYVARLADGNIWMTQNLDHDIVTTPNFYTPVNTDIPSNYTAGAATQTSIAGTEWFGKENSYDPGDLCWDGIIASNYSGDIDHNTTVCTDRHYHIGNYYGFSAAVSSNLIYNTDANQSVCPAGWTLPKGYRNTGSGSFSYLINQLSLTSGPNGNIHLSPTYYVYGGEIEEYWSGGVSSVGVGGYGYYWTSYGNMVEEDASCLEFTFNNTINPATYEGGCPVHYGISVRCVARQ